MQGRIGQYQNLPYPRLLEFADIDDRAKVVWRRRAGELHLIKQKRHGDQTVAKLMRLYEDKMQGVLPLGSCVEISGQG